MLKPLYKLVKALNNHLSVQGWPALYYRAKSEISLFTYGILCTQSIKNSALVVAVVLDESHHQKKSKYLHIHILTFYPLAKEYFCINHLNEWMNK